MSNLIPTPIVNKLGVSTTVHKRPAVRRPSSTSLSSLKPTISGAPRSRKIVGDPFLDRSVTVKPEGYLPWNGIIMRNSEMFETDLIQRGLQAYSWRNTDNEMTNRELYEYLRLGVSPIEAVALKGIGVSPAELPEDETLSACLPGSAGRIARGSKEDIVQNAQVVEAMAEAKIPAIKAAKVLESGLQDGHLNKGFDIKQLVALFSKYKYGVAIGSHRKVESSAVIDAVLSGDIPIELTKTHTRLSLSRMEHEFRRHPEQIKALRDEVDKDEFIRIADRALGTVHTEQPMHDTHRLMKKYGDAVLELDRPMVIELKRADGRIYGVEGARYLDEITRMTDKDTDIDVNDRYGDWQWETMGERDRIHDYKKVTMRGEEMLTLMDAGVSANNAYNLMYRKGMSVEQILIAVESQAPMSIAEGAL